MFNPRNSNSNKNNINRKQHQQHLTFKEIAFTIVTEKQEQCLQTCSMKNLIKHAYNNVVICCTIIGPLFRSSWYV